MRGRETGRGRASLETTARWTKIHIWKNSRKAMIRLQKTAPGPGQWLARPMITRAKQLKEWGVAVEVNLVPGHMSVEGNEKTSKAPRMVVEKRESDRCCEFDFRS